MLSSHPVSVKLDSAPPVFSMEWERKWQVVACLCPKFSSAQVSTHGVSKNGLRIIGSK